ncbi:MAG: DNA-3-methyladenine glycosylase 2 family protein [Thermoleophilia bacterium]|nr:DNA-3-methyladenine glycosylase 2 family protein [Thermoleophilia bacterium]
MDPIEVEVGPRSPFRLPRLTGGDRLVRERGSGFERLLVTDGAATVVSVRPSGSGRYLFTAEAVSPERLSGPGSDELKEAGEADLLDAIARMRFAVGIDLDLAPMRELFGEDPLLGPAITGLSPGRPHRRPYPWEALLWAITEQLIEYKRAAAIQRSMIRKWGVRLDDPGPCVRGFQDVMFTVPSPTAIAGASPAELEGCGLSARRSIAMIKVAREVDTGRTDLRVRADDRRLLAISEIGPWTIACLGLRGRGDPDALLAGDLSQVKLVGYLSGLGRIAEVEEVEAFYEKYAPWRGLAGEYLVSAQGRPVHGPGSTARIRMRQNISRAA